MQRIPFTEIQDLAGMKRCSENEDMPVFGNAAKSEHVIRTLMNIELLGWAKYYEI